MSLVTMNSRVCLHRSNSRIVHLESPLPARSHLNNCLPLRLKPVTNLSLTLDKALSKVIPPLFLTIILTPKINTTARPTIRVTPSPSPLLNIPLFSKPALRGLSRHHHLRLSSPAACNRNRRMDKVYTISSTLRAHTTRLHLTSTTPSIRMVRVPAPVSRRTTTTSTSLCTPQADKECKVSWALDSPPDLLPARVRVVRLRQSTSMVA